MHDRTWSKPSNSFASRMLSAGSGLTDMLGRRSGGAETGRGSTSMRDSSEPPSVSESERHAISNPWARADGALHHGCGHCAGEGKSRWADMQAGRGT
jgi:hypothetical protein